MANSDGFQTVTGISEFLMIPKITLLSFSLRNIWDFTDQEFKSIITTNPLRFTLSSWDNISVALLDFDS